MRIGIYNPYLDILGGGEKYIFDIAEFFLKRGDNVDFFWDDINIIKEIENRYNLNIKGINLLPNIFKRKNNLLKKTLFLRNYNYLFYNTDGSLFLPLAQRNILIVQSPAHIPFNNFFNRIKIKNWNLIICNSLFTKKTLILKWPQKKIFVLYPAIEVSYFTPLKKKDLIISSGRFTQALHSKKQEILIEAFKKISKKIKYLELVFAGGLNNNDKPYFEKLKKQSRNYNIKFYPNVGFKKLRELYGKAKIYWHAAGFGEDLEKYPEKAEHFGITTVEAMASGCIPLVFKAGGQLEIVDDKKNGFFWKTKEELISLTEKILKNYSNYKDVAENAIKKSRFFSKEVFEKRLREILCL